MKLKLLVDNGKNDKSIPVAENAFVIGRADDCQLRSRSQSVSRHHCVIQSENGTAIVKDLGSNNGVFVNNVRLPKDGSQKLQDGDRIVVGPHRFIVQTVTGDVEAATNSPVELSFVQSRSVGNKIRTHPQPFLPTTNSPPMTRMTQTVFSSKLRSMGHRSK